MKTTVIVPAGYLTTSDSKYIVTSTGLRILIREQAEADVINIIPTSYAVRCEVDTRVSVVFGTGGDLMFTDGTTFELEGGGTLELVASSSTATRVTTHPSDLSIRN